MKHLGTKRLETDRLILRQFTLEDADAMYNNWANDPEVTKYLMWPHHQSVEISQMILNDWTSQYMKEDFYQWAIVLKESNDEPIGTISVVHKDDAISMVHIGYCIGRNWWKRGITSEALATLIRFFFEEVGVNRIESRHDPRNPNSGRVMTKCGLRYEGTNRDADWNNQGTCDSVMYAILAKDYWGSDTNKALIKGLHHVSIKATVGSQYEETVRFYRDVLKMQELRTWQQGDNEACMFQTGQGIVEVFSTKEMQLPKGTIRHFALVTDDVDACAKAVREAGYRVFVEPKDVVFEAELNYQARIAFCIGPVGEEIEFIQEL